MKFLWVILSLLMCLNLTYSQNANQDNLKPMFKKIKSHIKNETPKGWKIWQLFKVTNTRIYAAWENKYISNNTVNFPNNQISLDVEIFPSVEKADQEFRKLISYISYPPIDYSMEKIFDYGDVGFCSYLKKAPSYLDRTTHFNFRRGRLTVSLSAPSDKLARNLARLIDNEIKTYISKNKKKGLNDE